MPTARERMFTILRRYNALAGRRTILTPSTTNPYLCIAPSSFSNINDGLTISTTTHELQNTLFTFQLVNEHQPNYYSFFINNLVSIVKYAIAIKLMKGILTELSEGKWTFAEAPVMGAMLQNSVGQTIPIRNGRRIWSYATMGGSYTYGVWYNPRPSILARPLVEEPNTELLVSPRSQAREVPLAPSLEAHFTPDHGFLPEELI